MHPEQCRAARAWIQWTQQELADAASVSLSTIRDFENGQRWPIKNNHRAIMRALEDAGILFLRHDDDSPFGIAFEDFNVKNFGKILAQNSDSPESLTQKVVALGEVA